MEQPASSNSRHHSKPIVPNDTLGGICPHPPPLQKSRLSLRIRQSISPVAERPACAAATTSDRIGFNIATGRCTKSRRKISILYGRIASEPPLNLSPHIPQSTRPPTTFPSSFPQAGDSENALHALIASSETTRRTSPSNSNPPFSANKPLGALEIGGIARASSGFGLA